MLPLLVVFGLVDSEVLVGFKTILDVSYDASREVLCERLAAFSGCDSRIAVCHGGGGRQNKRSGRELDEELELLERKVTSLRVVKCSKSVHRAQGVGEIFGVAVEKGHDIVAEVEGYGGVNAGFPVLAEFREAQV